MKIKYIYFLIIIFIASSYNGAAAENLQTLNKLSLEKGKKSHFKLSKAKSRYKNGDYNGALRIYRDIYPNNSDDAKLNFLIGKCEVQLTNMEDAIRYLRKAQALKSKMDDEIHFLVGEAYQYLGKIDSAILEYNTYKSTLKPSQFESDPVFSLLNQAKTAQNLMAHPVNVTITNLGSDVNSEYDDGMPAITADGKTLIFTSRRPDTKGGGIDPNTGQYFDDIYSSTWNDDTKKWSVSAPVEGDLNTPGHDAILGISPDGNTIFVYRNIEKVTGSGDIYFSTKKPDGKWATPRAMPKPINSTYFEGSCSLSPDGNMLYFVSERKGGYGNADIWKSKRIGKDQWSKPVNLGPVVNTEGDEMSVFMHPDGKTLFFSSNGHNTMGGYDIFMTQMKPDSSWTEPVNLGYPINTTKDEKSFTMTADGKKAYITSTKDNGFGGADIYEIDMSKYAFPIRIKGQEQEQEKSQTTPVQTPAAVQTQNHVKTQATTTQTQSPETPTNSAIAIDTNLSILKGSVIESSSAQQVDAEISIKDIVSGKVVKIFTNESGDYFVTLKGNKAYEISVDKAGYKKFTLNITLPFDKEKIFTLTKLIVLEKLPEEKK